MRASRDVGGLYYTFYTTTLSYLDYVHRLPCEETLWPGRLCFRPLFLVCCYMQSMLQKSKCAPHVFTLGLQA